MKRTKWIILAGILCVVLGGCQSSEKALCGKVALGAHTAVTPVSRSDPSWWMQRHQGVLDQVKQGSPEVIFIGDSITHGWENKGREIWDQHYAKYNPVNMGFSGDRTEHVLWRLANGEIDGISPKLAVLMIGTNNAARDLYSAEQIADGIRAIVCTLRTELPQTRILILAIFPRGSDDQRKDKTQDAPPNPLWAKNDKVNQTISKFADGKMIFYLDINKAFLNDQGVLTRDVMPDLLHPEEKGYAIWAESMEPTMAKLLN
jgi:beta-glucosidase